MTYEIVECVINTCYKTPERAMRMKMGRKSENNSALCRFTQ